VSSPARRGSLRPPGAGSSSRSHIHRRLMSASMRCQFRARRPRLLVVFLVRPRQNVEERFALAPRGSAPGTTRPAADASRGKRNPAAVALDGERGIVVRDSRTTIAEPDSRGDGHGPYDVAA